MGLIKLIIKISQKAEKAAGKMYSSVAKKAAKKKMSTTSQLFDALSKSELSHAGMLENCLNDLLGR